MRESDREYHKTLLCRGESGDLAPPCKSHTAMPVLSNVWYRQSLVPLQSSPFSESFTSVLSLSQTLALLMTLQVRAVPLETDNPLVLDGFKTQAFVYSARASIVPAMSCLRRWVQYWISIKT